MQNEIDYTKFSKLVKTNCCNYVENGPNKIRNYCLLEPKETELKCLIVNNKTCDWFANAVINYKHYKDPKIIKLQEEWRKTFDDELEKDNLKKCKCGIKFKPTSNNQKYCPNCSENNKLEHQKKAKERMKKSRLKKSATVTF